MLLDALVEEGLRLAAPRKKESLRIHKIVTGASFSTMKSQDKVFQNLYPLIVHLEDAYGFAYAEALVREEAIRAVVNRDARDVLADSTLELPLALKVAIIDALFCALREKDPPHEMRGSLDEQALARARVLLDGIPKGSHIFLLGPVSEIIQEAVARGMSIYVTDRSSQKIGIDYYGATVHPARSLRALLKREPKTTHVIATGMIFVSDTADEVFETAKENNLHLSLFMETGGRFGPALLGHGADRVVAEELPFYDFYGPTRYSVFEKGEHGIV